MLLAAERIEAVIETQRERPDFVLSVCGRRVGVEHTELQDPLLSKAAAVKRTFEDHVVVDLRSRGVGNDIDVHVFADEGAALFAWLGRKATSTLAERVGDLVARTAVGQSRDTSVDLEGAEVAKLGVQGIRAITVHRFRAFDAGPLCVVAAGYWGAGEAEVREAISAKERRLADYRADRSISEVWLLLVTGETITQTVDGLLVEGTSFSSQFERVYLLDVRTGKVRRIDARTAGSS